ncbi:hypothetical protein [Acinetobacter gerneri]|uniref:Uncharacterized protein n=1 Tax=Acinetobacter gerneri DSM 14967 = CIP 107464 = MTCC 9824 TaxID=1120926 RepID=N8YAW5_9GAMM|nr:hypothetical protein [Acinetobacter gerneri]ENV33922.1 hypothetical protein F960_01928 [Acinetobacter gerneri DSM 14967 = CIP 107464 = MTCC 9824]EPR82799.1 hypothetical protein L289_2717 [Acinetobacter gerneri DSM 14967 = CIP 107464 = MTCC 9824]
MSNIPQGLKTPGSYFDINTNTPRMGLPLNTHKVLFITLDVLSAQFKPVDVYDQANADKVFGAKSEAGRMIAAAVKSNRFVDAQAIALDVPAKTMKALLTETKSALKTESGEVLEQ